MSIELKDILYFHKQGKHKQVQMLLDELLLEYKDEAPAEAKSSSWDMYENVDRQGGTFSQSEIDDANAWK